MKSIAFVIPYFGRFNNYFQLWLDSCAANPTINWLIFTDDMRPFDYPHNVHVYQTTLENVKKREEEVFGFPVCLDKPYKLCDSKPLYGKIFEKELKGYDFWGYCDTDLIWGDIRKFITDDMLENNYRLFKWGHCSIMRNIPEVNEFYKYRVKGFDSYKYVLQSPIIYVYDEDDKHGCNLLFDTKFPDKYFKKSFAFDVNCKKKGLYYKAEGFAASAIIEYDNGHIYASRNIEGEIDWKEYMYVHFQKRDLMNSISGKRANKYIVTYNKFMEYQLVTVGNCKKLLPPPYTVYTREIKRLVYKFIYAFTDGATIKHINRNALECLLDRIFKRRQYYCRRDNVE